MPRQGRSLEIMVKHLQEFLAPHGIEVRSPEEFHHKGKKIGEIDITLRGHFGSSRIFIGIECRDRPHRGAEGRPWIREIIGKQQDLKVDKMIAVSTTGFTEQAIELAEASGIDLLIVEELTQSRPEVWLDSVTVHWDDERGPQSSPMILNACKRGGTGEVIAMSGTCTIDKPPRPFKMLATIKTNAEDNTRSMRLNFLTEDGQPYHLPAGTRFQLYGLPTPPP